MKNIVVLIFLLCGGFSLYGQEQIVYEGKSSVILDNKKDIIYVSNSSYKKKLVYEATVNAIKQACPTLINIEEFSVEDYDQADQKDQPTDRIVFNSKSGKSVQFQQVGEPVFRKSMNGTNRWECTVRGYVKEQSNYVPTTKNPIQKRHKKHDYIFGFGLGMTLPQVFQANLRGTDETIPLPRWDVTINPIYNFGVNFGVSQEIMLGLGFTMSKAKIVVDDNNVVGDNCYGGRVQIGFYRHTINPFVSLTGLYGTDKNVSFAIKQVGVGIDFLKGRFKIGAEVDCFWFSSNYHQGDVQFNNDGIFTLKGFVDTRFNAGINMKIYF